VSVNFYLSMWTISSSQLLGDVCSSKSLLVEIEKEKNSRTPHTHTSTHTQAHTHTPYTRGHAMHTSMHRHTLHTRHTSCTHPCTGTHGTHAHAHAQHCPHHAQQALHKGKKIEGKRGQSIQTIIFRS
jgi:hypothetical protein